MTHSNLDLKVAEDVIYAIDTDMEIMHREGGIQGPVSNRGWLVMSAQRHISEAISRTRQETLEMAAKEAEQHDEVHTESRCNPAGCESEISKAIRNLSKELSQ